MNNSINLTQNEAVKAIAPKRGQRIMWDSQVKGFGLRIMPSGAKAFILDYRFQGRQHRITIGALSEWSVAVARKEARELRRKIDLGYNPLKKRQDERDAPTLKDLWKRYEEEWLPQKSEASQRNEKSMWENLILPKLGKEKLHQLEADDFDKLHRDISNVRKAPIRANRTMASLRKALNLAVRWGWIEINPAVGVKKNPEDKRDRYLNKKEIAKLAEALVAHSNRTAANAIKLLMLTGARKSEVTGATWDMFDLDNGIWTKPSAHTKQRKLHRVPLNAPALNLLKEIKKQAEKDYVKKKREDKDAKFSPYVFPSDISPDQPIQELRRTWVDVCTQAKLTNRIQKKNRDGKPVFDDDAQPVMIDWPNVRIHDLRHSFASILVSGGASLPLIGQMLVTCPPFFDPA